MDGADVDPVAVTLLDAGSSGSGCVVEVATAGRAGSGGPSSPDAAPEHDTVRTVPMSSRAIRCTGPKVAAAGSPTKGHVRPPARLAAAMRTLFAVGLGGAVGSMARYAVGSLLGRRAGWEFWMATMAVNISGALALGILVGLFGDHVTDDPALRTGLTVGLLGGYTTFSTWMVESVELVGKGHVGAGLFNVLAAATVGLMAAIGGLAIGRALAV